MLMRFQADPATGRELVALQFGLLRFQIELCGCVYCGGITCGAGYAVMIIGDGCGASA